MPTSMQSIFQEHFASYAQSRTLSLRELRAASAIMKCGTAAMGGHVLACPEAHFQRIQYHSCRHRSCPRCAEQPRQQWVQATLGRLLPCEHFHAVFTLPHDFIALWAFNREVLSNALLDGARESLLQLCADPRHLGARVGLLMALHTWGRTLSQHPHVHCLVSAGGIDPDGQWKRSRSTYLVPVKALAALFRGKLLARLSDLLKRGVLKLPSEQDQSHWRACIACQYRVHWNVQLADRYAHGRGVALYLARYVKGGPLPKSRALWASDQRVSFAYTDHRDGRAKTLSLNPEQFLGRVLWHAPPRGQHMVRYCGLYASGAAHQHAQARAALGAQPTPAMPHPLAAQGLDTPSPLALQCPQCKRPLARTLNLLPVHQDGEISNTPPTTVEALGPTLSSSGHPTAINDFSLHRRLSRRRTPLH
jgi:Putative transposase/Transposase zinc-binding domain